MNVKPKILPLFCLLLLLVSPGLWAGSFTENSQEESFTFVLILFLLMDILLGCILVFGKMKQTRKKHRSFNYLKSHYL